MKKKRKREIKRKKMEEGKGGREKEEVQLFVGT